MNGCVDRTSAPESTDADNGCVELQLKPESTKGLSKLQRSILAYLAEHQGRSRKNKHPNGVDAYYWELLHHVVGLPLGRPLSMTYWNPDPLDRSAPGAQRFDPTKIGRARYRSAVSALSRAVKRLESRGLITVYNGTMSHWSGCSLNEGGAS